MPKSETARSSLSGTGHVVLERGAGPGRTLVLHAAGSSPRALDRFANELSGLGGQVLVPALEHGGESLIGSGPQPFAEAVALASQLIAVEGDGPRILVGHSMGGLIAVLTLMEGVKVDAAVLYEPIVLSLLDAEEAGDRAAIAWDRACIAQFRDRCAAGDPEAGVGGFIEAYVELPWNALPASARADLVAHAPRLLAEAAATNGTKLDPEIIRRIDTPVLLLDGSRSPDAARRMVLRLAKLLPDAEHATIDDVGHMGPVAAPKAVAAAIASFLRHRGVARLP